MNIEEIIISDLGRLDAARLQEILKGQGEFRDTRSLSPGKLGDMSTVDIVVRFGPAIVGVIGLWLLAPRKGKSFRRTIKVKEVTGSVREETIKFDDFSRESPSDAVVKALTGC